MSSADCHSSAVIVTGFIECDGSKQLKASFELYMDMLQYLIATGSRVVVFVSRRAAACVPLDARNVTYVPIELEDTWVFQALQAHEASGAAIGLPPRRNACDTARYMQVMNAKVELMYRAMQLLRRHTHFIWADFGLFKVFRDKARCVQKLATLTQSALHTPLLVLPGCWAPAVAAAHSIWEVVSWRFCGGLLIGDRTSLTALHALYLEYFVPFVRARNLVWEVNFWAFLERELLWKPTWYFADHNDSMVLHAPSMVFTIAAVIVGGSGDILEARKKALCQTICLGQAPVVHVTAVGSSYTPCSPSTTLVLAPADASIARQLQAALRTLPCNQWVVAIDGTQTEQPAPEVVMAGVQQALAGVLDLHTVFTVGPCTLLHTSCLQTLCDGDDSNSDSDPAARLRLQAWLLARCTLKALVPVDICVHV